MAAALEEGRGGVVQIPQMSAQDAAIRVSFATTCKSVGIAIFGQGFFGVMLGAGAIYFGYKCAAGHHENETRSQVIGTLGIGTTTAAAWAVAWTVAPVAAIPVTLVGALTTTLALAPEARGALYRKFCHLININ